MTNNKQVHRPVLLQETLELLAVQAGAYYLDATFGHGGHSRAILEAGGKVIAFDFDQQAINAAQENFKEELACGHLTLIRENFTQLNEVVTNLKKSLDFEISGVLFDFGTSTEQLMSKERGFSFRAENETLDMRMDDRLGVKACDLLKLLGEKQMADMFFNYGGEKDARRIAKEIVKIRKENPEELERVGKLVEIVAKVKGQQKNGRINPATKVFQALRIVVNDELDNIEKALPVAFQILKESAAINKRFVCISFHEGEDRLVKTFFTNKVDNNQATLLSKKAIMASPEELLINKRARSAKLRAIAI